MWRDSFLIGLLARIRWIGPRVVFRLQRAGFGFPTQDWPGLAKQVARLRPSTLSVDVYDTCVIRDLAGDAAIEHAIDHVARTFDRVGDRPTVAEDLERTLCRPVPGAAEALAKIRAAGTEVVFVSDTDRSSELLIDILRSSGIFVDGDRLVASCEAGATKSDGDLLPMLFDADGRSKRRRRIWHAGNHIWADVAMAAAAGLKPIPMLDADLNRYEQALTRRSAGPGPSIAGAARLARVGIQHEQHSGAIGEHDAAIQVLGANVAGQTMAAFVLWIAEQCRVEKVDHVGFLARDGELPLEVARAIPADHWEGRTLQYIHASRLTWSLAAASAMGVDKWIAVGTQDGDFLHSKRHHVPFEALLARTGLLPADIGAMHDHRWLAGLDPSLPLPVEAVADWEALLKDSNVHHKIQERADERLGLIVDRLRADGMPTGKYALVDVGWRGRLATQVSAVLSHVVNEEPVHLHFGGDMVLPDVDDTVPIRRFAFDGYSDPDPIDGPVSCIETMTASGKPRVIEYRRTSDGEVEMVFDNAGFETGELDTDRAQMWTGALRAAQSIPSRTILNEWGITADPVADEIKSVLDHWWNRPEPHEVEAIADLTFEHDEAGTALRPLVTPYRLSELRGNSGAAKRQWPQGSMVASGRLMASVVGLKKRLQR